MILAVGQRVQGDLLAAAGLQPEGGRLLADPVTQRTTADDVYAGGDVATGPSTVIAAIGAGRRAAEAIYGDLRRETDGRWHSTPAPGSACHGVDPVTDDEHCFQPFDPSCASPLPRYDPALVPPEDRSICDEDTCTVGEPVALAEAGRCFNCGCIAVSASDLAPVLVALDASVVTTEREIAAADFFAVGPTTSTVLRPGEVALEVRLPAPNATRAAYEKYRLRNAIDFPIISAAVALRVEERRVADARVVLGAAAPVPLRAAAIEDALRGLDVSPEELAQAARVAAAESGGRLRAAPGQRVQADDRRGRGSACDGTSGAPARFVRSPPHVGRRAVSAPRGLSPARGLRVDVGSGRAEREELDPEVVRSFLGGRGSGAYLLLRERAHEVDPLSPENPLIFAPGPLTGTRAPSAGRYSASARSPLTGTAFDGNSGGAFGIALHRLGLEYLILTGACDTPSYLVIDGARARRCSRRRHCGVSRCRPPTLASRSFTVAVRPA